MPSVVRYFFCFLVFIYCLSSQAGMPAVAKQEEVMLRLANEGNAEAYKVLAQFYADRSSYRSHYFNQSIRWRITAARQGDVGSVYLLGYYGLQFEQLRHQLKDLTVHADQTRDKWMNEGLIMISEAAILGNPRARIDLVMLPKLLLINKQSLEEAFNEALTRLIKGQTINCEFFNCDEQFSSHDIAYPLLHYSQDIQIFLDEKSHYDCKKFGQCLLSMAEPIEFIDQASEQQYQRIIMKKNLKIMNKYKGLNNNDDLSDKTWDEKANMDRNRQRIQAARTAVSQYSDEDRKKLQDKINEILNEINLFRKEPNQIKSGEVIDMMKRP